MGGLKPRYNNWIISPRNNWCTQATNNSLEELEGFTAYNHLDCHTIRLNCIMWNNYEDYAETAPGDPERL